MEKLSCYIADDEPLALQLLQGYVQKTPFLELKGSFSNAFDVLSAIQKQKVDLVFLDIQMPDLNGIELSKALPQPVKIIFTTAFSEYALEGFKVNALDYLLKPFDYAEFLKAALKAKEYYRLQETTKKSNPESDKDFIFVKSEYKQVRIPLQDVCYFEGLKDYVKIWLSSQPEKPILTLMSLKNLEEALPAERFMRIHRSYIVSLDKIKMVERSQILILNERITLAEQYKEKFNAFIASKSIQ